MSASLRAPSAPGSPRLEQRTQDRTVTELNFQAPEESRKTQLPPVRNQNIPDEFLVNLTSTICDKSALRLTAHQRQCTGHGIRRPDAVWHHPLGRKKYKHFLEQPTSLTGAGRDISFLCDAVETKKKAAPLPPLADSGDTLDLSLSESLIPEEYHIVKNRGLQSLRLYEDAFTVQLQDDEQKLRVFPSLRPSGRQEVVQLMKMMDDMLAKAGVDQQSEELTELSQMEGLLELVKVEQSIYNIVFHELIRQVSVSCTERGQLLAKLRQRYQSLLERIPRRLKALHTEAVAQRALDRRLTEEVHRIKSCIQELSVELAKIRDHDAFVSQQTERAQQQLAVALEQARTDSDVVQGYHELYELQRSRLEAQLLQMKEQRDYWSQLTFRLAFKMIRVKKLQLFKRLHVSAQSWFKTAEHCGLYLSSKDTEDLNVIIKLSDLWRERAAAFMSWLKTGEQAQREQLSSIQQGVAEWLHLCSEHNKCPEPKYDKASVEKLCTDLKQWSQVLALQCEHYQGEKLLSHQQSLRELAQIQEQWVNKSLDLFRRHPTLGGEPPAGRHTLRGLDQRLSELLAQLDARVTGEPGIYQQLSSLLGLMESWSSKLDAASGRPETMSGSDWLSLEKALLGWKSLAEEAAQNFSRTQIEKENKSDPDVLEDTDKVLVKVKEFITGLSNYIEGENQRLREVASSIYMAQLRCMIDLLLLILPDQYVDQSQEQDEHHTTATAQTLDDDAKVLAEKLNFFSRYIIRSCKLILEEQLLLDRREAEAENEMNEYRKLQTECSDWVETCTVVLIGIKGDAMELLITQADSVSCRDAPVSPDHITETPVRSPSKQRMNVNEAASAEPVTDNKHEAEAEQRKCTDEGQEAQQEGELTSCESPLVKLIGYDGNITERRLGESSVHLSGVGYFETEELVVSPVTDDAQKAFSDLTTVALLQQELYDSELRVQGAEQRALRAEEALQAALQKIQDQERQLQGRTSLEPKSSEEGKKTPPPATPSTPQKKTPAEVKATSNVKKTKKR